MRFLVRERRRQEGRRGFTLIELMVSMSIGATLMTISMVGLVSYSRSADVRGTSSIVEAVLRNAEVRSETEALQYCLVFAADGKSLDSWRGGCTTATGGRRIETTKVLGVAQIVDPQFLQRDGTVTRNLIFYPRGVATGGTVKITRPGGNKTFTIKVERLTSRVSISRG